MNLMDLLEILFPKKCVACNSLGSYLCQSCSQKIEYLEIQKCPYCYQPAISGLTHPKCQRKFGLDGVISLVNYKTPVRELIKSLKYRYTTNLLGVLEERILFYKLQLNNTLKKSLLIPVPMYRTKQKARGFNQAELLGELFAKKFNFGFENKMVIKSKATESQVGLSQKERAKNVKDVFILNKDLESGVENYFVFDDVWTSGATLKEIAYVLKKAGAVSVWGLTLAHRD